MVQVLLLQTLAISIHSTWLRDTSPSPWLGGCPAVVDIIHRGASSCLSAQAAHPPPPPLPSWLLLPRPTPTSPPALGRSFKRYPILNRAPAHPSFLIPHPSSLIHPSFLIRPPVRRNCRHVSDQALEVEAGARLGHPGSSGARCRSFHQPSSRCWAGRPNKNPLGLLNSRPGAPLPLCAGGRGWVSGRGRVLGRHGHPSPAHDLCHGCKFSRW